MPRSEVQQSRCEFPGCTCTCMHRHNTQDICVRCMHHSAWHRPISQQRQAQPAPETASVREDQDPLDESPGTTIQSQQQIIDNLLTLLDLDAGERNKCCVCMERPCDVVLKPCGHARFCKRCMDNASISGCPICRSSIRHKIAFIPL